MKRMLLNATHAEELRVAIVDGQKLLDLDLESTARSEKKGNIYKGVVTKVEPSLEACFVDYGAEKQGFLPLKEIYREYFGKYDSKVSITDLKIDSVIKEGQEMIVQVDKDERGTKGAALTTFISLAGRFLVFMPNNPKGGGISRRIAGEERIGLRDILSKLDVGSQHSLIARTEGIGRTQEELQWDLDFLLKLWGTIEQASNGPQAPFLIYQGSNLIVRSIRDHLSEDIAEIIVDDEEVYDRAEKFINQMMPHDIKKLKLYKGSAPLFSRYQIEGQIDSVFNREVSLPSGGSLSIDHTEALIAIDVNSARATKGGDIEETALQTNLEAVEEVARQLRIRDMGGIVVIDLIDMSINRNQRTVENKLKESLKADRARVQVGHISRFGLLEMSRQRLRPSISDTNYRVCPRCQGMGTIRSVVSSSLNLLRIIEDEALKENTEAIQVALPLDMSTYLINEKRHELYQLEARLASRIIIIPSSELASPHFQIKRLRSEELDALTGISSFKQKIDIESADGKSTDKNRPARPERAHVEFEQIDHGAPPPPADNTAASPGPNKPGIFTKMFLRLFGKGESTVGKPAEIQPRNQDRHRRGSNKNQRGNNKNKARNTRQQSRSQAGGQGEQKSNRNQQSRQKSQPRNQKPRNSSNHFGSPGADRVSPFSRDPKRPQKKYSKPPQVKPYQSRADTPRSDRGQYGYRRSQPHPGPIVTPENVPHDIPDDIGNRKN